MATQEIPTMIEDSLTVRHGDIVITVSASADGILDGRTHQELLKYCADVLLQETDAGSLENALDTSIAVQETLKDDYSWKPLEIMEFMKNWRKRLYLKQIGEQSKSEEYSAVRTLAIEPSSDVEGLTGEKPEEKKESKKETSIVIDENHIAVGIASRVKVETEEDKKERTTFSLSEGTPKK